MWPPFERAQRTHAVCKLEQATQLFSTQACFSVTATLTQCPKTLKHCLHATSVSYFLWLTSGNFSETSSAVHFLWYKMVFYSPLFHQSLARSLPQSTCSTNDVPSERSLSRKMAQPAGRI